MLTFAIGALYTGNGTALCKPSIKPHSHTAPKVFAIGSSQSTESLICWEIGCLTSVDYRHSLLDASEDLFGFKLEYYEIDRRRLLLSLEVTKQAFVQL